MINLGGCKIKLLFELLQIINLLHNLLFITNISIYSKIKCKLYFNLFYDTNSHMIENDAFIEHKQNVISRSRRILKFNLKDTYSENMFKSLQLRENLLKYL